MRQIYLAHCDGRISFVEVGMMQNTLRKLVRVLFIAGLFSAVEGAAIAAPAPDKTERAYQIGVQAYVYACSRSRWVPGSSAASRWRARQRRDVGSELMPG